jgi:hypothetical protein
MPGTQPVGDPQGISWTLAFDDEFNGTSIDPTKWVVYNDPAEGCPGTAATCHPDHDNNGVASSTASCREGAFGPNGEGVLDLDTNGTNGCDIASAWVPYTRSLTQNGANAWELAVGDYVEARVWMPACPGCDNGFDPVANWSSWWTSGASWPDNGEYDMVEGSSKATCSYHSGDTVSGDNNAVSPVCTPTPISAWAGSWHVYGVYRGAGGAVFYWDGVEVNCDGASQTTARSGSTKADVCADPLPITDQGGPQALRFVMGTHGATSPTSINGPAGDMYVDWVRGYTPSP